MGSVSLSHRLEYDKVAFDRKNIVHLLITLEGSKPDKSTRKPLSLGVAIDCSGSMAGQKIEYAKKSLTKLIEHLTSEDSLGIVGFSDTVFSISPMTRMTAEAKERMKSDVSKLRPLQSTNLSGAMLDAYGMVKDAPGDVVRAFLFTDGLPTAGETQPGRLIEMASQKPSKAGLTCFGYGADHDPELLASMAKRGGGNFYFVKTPDECPGFFGRELGGLISCMAQTIKIKIQGKPDVKILEVLNDLDVEASEDGSRTTISVDDLYAEERRQIVVRIELPEASKALAARPFKLADIEVSYHDLRSNEPRVEDQSVKIEFVKPEDAQKDPAKEVLEQIALVKAADAQEEAQKLANAGNFAGAQQVIQNVMMFCRSLHTPLADAVAQDLGHNVINSYQDESTYTTDASYLHSNNVSYRRGRASTSGSKGLFGTHSQQQMEESFAGDGAPSVPLIQPLPQIPQVHSPLIIDPSGQPVSPKEEKSKSAAKKRKHRR